MGVIARSAFWTTFTTVTALLTAVQCSQPFALCGLECCTFWPNCTSATAIDCRCSNEKIHLQRGDIPKSARQVNIFGTSDIVIDRDATADLFSLQKFRLVQIGNLAIRSEGLALPAQRNEFDFFQVYTADEVRIEASGMSGYWMPNAAIHFESIDRLIFSSHALNFKTTDVGPMVRMSRVKKLLLERQSFTGEIGNLSMEDVSLRFCKNGSFGGNIRHLDFLRVKIEEAESGCVNGADSMAVLSVRFSTITNVRPLAFSGNICDVLMDHNTIRTVEENGFHLKTSSLKINASRFHVLESIGLNVEANKFVLLNNVSVSMLRRNGLKGLRLDPDGDATHLVITKLQVRIPDTASFAFADGAQVRLDDLDMRTSCSCPVDLWSRQLVDAGSTEHLRQPQLEVLDQLRRQCDCPDVQTPESQARPSATFDASSSTQRPASPTMPTFTAGSTPQVKDTRKYVIIVGVSCAVPVALVLGVAFYRCRMCQTPSADDHLDYERRFKSPKPPTERTPVASDESQATDSSEETPPLPPRLGFLSRLPRPRGTQQAVDDRRTFAESPECGPGGEHPGWSPQFSDPMQDEDPGDVAQAAEDTRIIGEWSLPQANYDSDDEKFPERVPQMHFGHVESDGPRRRQMQSKMHDPYS